MPSATQTESRRGIFQEINERIAAVTLEESVLPTTKRPEAGCHVVGFATDTIKRIFVVRMGFMQEHQAATESLEKLQKAVRFDPAVGQNRIEWLREIASNGAPTTSDLDRLEELLSKVKVAGKAMNILDELLWLEILTTYAKEFAGKPNAAIYEDWSIGWQEKTDVDADLFTEIFGHGGHDHVSGDSAPSRRSTH